MKKIGLQNIEVLKEGYLIIRHVDPITESGIIVEDKDKEFNPFFDVVKKCEGFENGDIVVVDTRMINSALIQMPYCNDPDGNKTGKLFFVHKDNIMAKIKSNSELINKTYNK